jgi:hypothetical protein
MARRVIVGDLRVQRIDRRDGLRSWTIVWPEGRVHEEADRFLRVHDGSGTQRTYAYYLVDHLRWLERECLALAAVGLRDLERYMGVVGAEVRMPFGEPWRAGKRPYGRAALSTAAACLKGFYLHQSSFGVNTELGGALGKTRLPTRADRSRSFLGHVKTQMPANPLAPRRPHRRHPKMLPDGARDGLLVVAGSARDRMTVTWLADGGACGSGSCAACTWRTCTCGRTPAAGSAARRTCTSATGGGTRTAPRRRRSTSGGPSAALLPGGLVKLVSPAMIHAYFEYMTSGEYPRGAGHGMLLVQLHGPDAGQPWAPVGARRMLARAGKRAGLGVIKPHAFRHSFTSGVLKARSCIRCNIPRLA